MNVYFIDPQYVKPEGWNPLLKFLKVKKAYSFIPVNELPTRLLDIIQSYLVYSYFNQDYKSFCDNCAYWLRAHFEKNIQLNPNDNSVSCEENKKYSSWSALKNLKNLDEENCLVLLRLESSFDYEGCIEAPTCYVGELSEHNLPTHIAKYCLNILHKKYGHNKYDI